MEENLFPSPSVTHFPSIQNEKRSTSTLHRDTLRINSSKTMRTKSKKAQLSNLDVHLFGRKSIQYLCLLTQNKHWINFAECYWTCPSVKPANELRDDIGSNIVADQFPCPSETGRQGHFTHNFFSIKQSVKAVSIKGCFLLHCFLLRILQFVRVVKTREKASFKYQHPPSALLVLHISITFTMLIFVFLSC